MDEYRYEAEGESDEFDGIDLKEALDLPDRLSPLRLPPEDELAAQARRSDLLRQARRLAEWVGDRPRRLTDGELTAADTVAAAEALGLAVRDAPAVRRLSEVPRAAQLWELALAVEFVEGTDTRATTGRGVARWPDGPDPDLIDVWDGALGAILYGEVPLESDDSARDAPMFGSAAIATVVALFLARDGIPVTEVRQMFQELATLASPVTDEAGGPVDALLAVLAEHGAVTLDEAGVRLTPLAQYAVYRQLDEAGVEIPLLPPVELMTAADLAAVGAGGTTDELENEATAWLERRSPETAVTELLTVAATSRAAERMTVTAIAADLGSAGEPRWRQALEEPMLRPYAKIALAQLGGASPERPEEIPTELRPNLVDLAVLLTDTLAGMADTLEPDELMEQLSTAVPSGEEERLFDQMWRLDHPDAHDMLRAIGAHHPDKKVAKAARKAAFKCAPRGARD